MGAGVQWREWSRAHPPGSRELHPSRKSLGAAFPKSSQTRRRERHYGLRLLRASHSSYAFRSCPHGPQVSPPPPNSNPLSWFQPAWFTVHKSHVFPPCVAAFRTRTSSRAARLVYFLFRKEQIPPLSPFHSVWVPLPLNRLTQNLQTYFATSLSFRVTTSLANLLS